jgi:hypothetical protein
MILQKLQKMEGRDAAEYFSLDVKKAVVVCYIIKPIDRVRFQADDTDGEVLLRTVVPRVIEYKYVQVLQVVLYSEYCSS